MALLKRQHTPYQIGKQGMVAMSSHMVAMGSHMAAMGSQAHLTHGNMHSRVCLSAEQTAVGVHLSMDQQYVCVC